ncbi:nucleoside triphosphate pyrophosphatase [Microbulbifer sp.]|uniref:Maf family protein n=1 Tax=Microbulbifer sp. TaxID=1908541 RepID=UPI00338EDD9B
MSKQFIGRIISHLKAGFWTRLQPAAQKAISTGAHTMRRIILASSSPYRRQLLERLRLPFESASPHINEERLAGEAPEQLAARLAAEKAQALQPSHDDALIIGSDQVAECDGRILGKPGTTENAYQQLRLCAGKQVNFHTGVSLLDTRSGTHQTTCEIFSVHFRNLTDAEIERYIALDNPLDCAGSFKAEGLGIALFGKMEGSDPSSLIGLPLIQLISMLRKAGVSPLTR